MIVQEAAEAPYQATVIETRPAGPAGGVLRVRRVNPGGWTSTRRIDAAAVLRVLAPVAREARA